MNPEKKRIYLDNAATTPVAPEVLEVMLPFYTDFFGNPSSTHAHGRTARAAIELARKNIAARINANPLEIYFTSGGTEADNTLLHGAVEKYRIKNIITSPIEHHAVLHTLQYLSQTKGIEIHFVDIDSKGLIDYNHLNDLLHKQPHALVSLMHANNELGNISDLERIGLLCKEHGAYFHSDTVQAMGHFTHDMKTNGLHSAVCSAHKLHGPKGVGFMYIKSDKKITPYIHGGGQERDYRGGTENVAGIVGLGKAMEIACDQMEEHAAYIKGLKTKMITLLKTHIHGVAFNGDSENVEGSLYTVLNVSFPPGDANDMLLFNLDLEGISASGGSACASGAAKGSHVLNAIGANPDRTSVRFSFSRYTTMEEIEKTVKILKNILER
ncbi:MAG: cysteine desulfurase [Cyclobacteriaceae bacterium]|nr:cysteine desulfurase [Cyclobacteriaceae bacterium]